MVKTFVAGLSNSNIQAFSFLDKEVNKLGEVVIHFLEDKFFPVEEGMNQPALVRVVIYDKKK